MGGMNRFIFSFWFLNSYKKFMIALTNTNKCLVHSGFFFHHHSRFKEVVFQTYDLRSSAFAPFLTQ